MKFMWLLINQKLHVISIPQRGTQAGRGEISSWANEKIPRFAPNDALSFRRRSAPAERGEISAWTNEEIPRFASE
jgi:hypothetical protein